MLTAEKLKNAAPVNSKQESETEPMPPSPKKSPLVSTLVNIQKEWKKQKETERNNEKQTKNEIIWTY